MAIKKISNTGDYDINSGVLESWITFKDIAPSLRVTNGSHIIKDLGRFYNEAFICWIRTANGNAFKYQMLLGCDVNGNGLAIRFDGTASGLTIKLVNITSFGNPTYDSIIEEREVTDFILISNNTWHKLKVAFVNSKIQVILEGRLVFESTSAVATGNYFGHSGIDTTNETLVSDLYYYTDQIFWGNVNSKGIPSDKGIVYFLRQDTVQLYSRTMTDQYGNYMVFVEDDPIDLHKYIVLGYISNKTYLQPRGYGNLTL